MMNEQNMIEEAIKKVIFLQKVEPPQQSIKAQKAIR